MGGRGSGRTRESVAVQKLLGASPKQSTEATKEWVKRLKTQAGDRMFSVDRKYLNGEWYTVGNVDEVKEEVIGATFGGGTYRVYEMTKATEERTDKPPLTMKLSPVRWPIKKEFAQEPRDAEAEQLQDLSGDDDVAGAGAAVNINELAARIEARIRRELEDKNERAEQKRELASLKELVLNGGSRQVTGGGAAEQMALIREMFSMFKEMQPPAMLNPMMTSPASPVQSLRESLEAVKILREDLKGLGIGAEAPNPMLAKLTDSLVALGEKAMITAQVRAASPAPQGGRQLALQQRQVAPADAGPTEEEKERDYQIMVNELTQRLATDQADQLSPAPKTHISETATWIQSKWTGDSAATVWVRLRDTFKQFDDGQVLFFLEATAPQLADSPAKKAWLTSLVELIRKA